MSAMIAMSRDVLGLDAHLRDHLVAIKWDQQPPAPRLPADVIGRTQEKYLAALKNLLES